MAIPPPVGKILRFPAPLDDTAGDMGEAPAALGAAAQAGAAAPEPSNRRRSLLNATGPAGAQPSGSPWDRIAFVRRRRAEQRRASEPAAQAAGSIPERPSVAQLVSWLLALRRGGAGSIGWNAADLPLEAALMRAAQLDDDAIVEVVAQRVLVVEPLHARRARRASDPADAAGTAVAETGPPFG
jgi:hypothetical protein